MPRGKMTQAERKAQKASWTPERRLAFSKKMRATYARKREIKRQRQLVADKVKLDQNTEVVTSAINIPIGAPYGATTFGTVGEKAQDTREELLDALRTQVNNYSNINEQNSNVLDIITIALRLRRS